MKKQLYIIPGISGAVGNALLAQVLQDPHAVVYGVSREAKAYTGFINPETEFLYPKTFICSLGSIQDAQIKDFVTSIDFSSFNKVMCVHALGHFPFEINKKGEHVVNHDYDGDGINDITLDLSCRIFKSFTTEIRKVTNKEKKPFASVLFGSIVDQYRLKEHESWWKVMKMTKKYMHKAAGKHSAMHLVNISSILCSHEIATRPFVFIDTDADPAYWLAPAELATYLEKEMKKRNFFSGFHEHVVYKKRPDITHGYFSAKVFKERKMSELFGKS